MGAQSQFNRVLFILDAIQRRTYPTAVSLAREYEVSERTIRRDIDWLRDFHNAPIVFDRVRHGYILTDTTYRLPALTLTEGELIALTVGEHVLASYRNSPWHEPVRAAFERIEALLPESVSISAQLLSRAVSVITPPASRIDADVWQRVMEALRLRVAVEITYGAGSREHAQPRRVNPYRLVAHDGGWYLIGWSHHHEEVRVFSLARIHRVTVSADRFDVPSEFAVEDYIDPELGVYNHGSAAREEVVVRFSRTVAHLVTERTWHSSQTVHSETDGSVTLTLHTNQLEQILYRVMSYGPAAEIIAPQTLRTRAAEWVSQMATVYSAS